MKTPETTFGLTLAEMQHNLDLGKQLALLIQRLLGQTPVAPIVDLEPVAA